MPDISMFEPRIINGVVEKFLTPPELVGLNLFPTRANPIPLWQFDIVSGTRNMASINTPGSMGKIVTKATKGTIAGGFIYTREKKIFDPTTLHWLRAPGEVAQSNAEQEVTRELRELSNRFDRLKEWSVWKMFSGSLAYTRDNTIISIDYLMSASHKPTAGVLWTSPNSDPMSDIKAWKRLITHDGQANADVVYANDNTMSVLVEHAKVRSMLSDEQRRNYISENTLRRFVGLEWRNYDLGFVDDFTVPGTSTFTTYIPDGYIAMLATENSPWIMLQGPSADDDAPDGFTGRFAKSWKDPDPSQRQYLMEESFMPILLRPEQVVYARVF